MGKKGRRNKIGRNSPCPCGSGKKYKHCHGALNTPNTATTMELDKQIQSKIAEVQAEQAQQQKQQGLGRPIISTVFHGYRIVAVGNQVRYSKNWLTFHDFLLDYIKSAIGSEWGNNELKKEYDQRHPIIQWYDLICKQQRETIKTPGEVHSAPMTGAISAYLGLAYNLYLLAHNSGIQQQLIERLKHKDQFHGAFYETFVAAAFIKAGFSLEFEDESDSRTSHCEFTATHPITGKKFSVEAKAREPYRDHARVGNQLHNALKKIAAHERIIFIDVNLHLPEDAEGDIGGLEGTMTNLRGKESTLTINGDPAPSAYIVLTNHPFIYSLETTDVRRAAIAEGFKIPDFKYDADFPSIREALRSREKHKEVFDLMESVREHYEIPSTFDGEIPEFAFGDTHHRLKIGNKYLVPVGDGQELPGELTDAIVIDKDKIVHGVYRLDDGRSIIATCPLSDEEYAAYTKYPVTFFGRIRKPSKNIDNPLEMFDFFYESYKHTPREKLLEFLKDHPDIEKLQNESQEELAITCCEGWVYSALNRKDQQPE